MTTINASPTPDQRGAMRTKSFLRANIIFNNKLSTLDCIVRNMSAAGARLQLPNGHLAPDQFDVHFPNRRETRRARATWRGPDGLGVSFLDPDEPPQPETLTDRARALAAENEELRQRVHDLKRRLAEAGRFYDASY